MEITELYPKKATPRLTETAEADKPLFKQKHFWGFVVVVVLNLAPKIGCKRAKLATSAVVWWVPEAVEFLTRLSVSRETHRAFHMVIAVNVLLLPSNTFLPTSVVVGQPAWLAGSSIPSQSLSQMLTTLQWPTLVLAAHNKAIRVTFW